MYLTLGQAASACGKSKSTLSKDLKSGKLSYQEKNSSGYKINTAELERVYATNIKKTPKTNDSERFETPTGTLEIAALKATIRSQEQTIAHMQSKIDDLEEQRSDLRQQRDKWEQQATAHTRLLEHQSNKRRWFNLLGKKEQ